VNNASKRNSAGRSRFSRGQQIILVILLLGAVYAFNTFTHNSSNPPPLSSATIVPVSTPNGASGGDVVAGNPSGALPANANKPQPPPTVYQGCPATGDGGDAQLNTRKNRIDAAPWYPVAISSILSLAWPKSIEQKPRAGWSSTDTAQISQYEGIPVQIEGWLAGAKQQGPESCNCHSANDTDNHLWVVDSPDNTRAQSVVAEVTPRVRALHPGWAFSRIQKLVTGRVKVRISGWLLMDQEHPDQVGKTRGTIWEIHPIVAFDVQGPNGWVSLDTGLASTTITQGGDAVPTEDPSLPPTVSDPYTTATLPTATPAAQGGQTTGQLTALGPVQISDIFYDGTKGSHEPDEYVEIANVGAQPVSMDGWVLHDIYGDQRYTWHGYTLPAASKIRVYTNEVHNDSGGFTFASNDAIWANKGDAAELLDSTGTVVSTFSYGSAR